MDQQIHFEKLLVVLSLHLLFSGNFNNLQFRVSLTTHLTRVVILWICYDVQKIRLLIKLIINFHRDIQSRLNEIHTSKQQPIYYYIFPFSRSNTRSGGDRTAERSRPTGPNDETHVQDADANRKLPLGIQWRPLQFTRRKPLRAVGCPREWRMRHPG